MFAEPLHLLATHLCEHPTEDGFEQVCRSLPHYCFVIWVPLSHTCILARSMDVYQ